MLNQNFIHIELVLGSYLPISSFVNTSTNILSVHLSVSLSVCMYVCMYVCMFALRLKNILSKWVHRGDSVAI